MRQDIVKREVEEKAGGSYDTPCVICSRGPPGDPSKYPPFNVHNTRHCGFLWTMTKDGLDWIAKKRSRKLTQSMLSAMIGVPGYDTDSLMAHLKTNFECQEDDDACGRIALLSTYTQEQAGDSMH